MYVYILSILCIVKTSTHLDFLLSQTDARPMYIQIMDQVQQRVAVGDWPAGSKLPSIRELAVALNVSVITVKRAYLELERNEVIVTQQGKGSWVAVEVNRSQLQLDELDRVLGRAAILAASLGMTGDDLYSLLEERMGADRGEEKG